MGWGKGSSLMRAVITSLLAANVPVSKRQLIYIRLIPAWEDADCDTLAECLTDNWSGGDGVFDAIYKSMRPAENSED